MLPVSPLSKGYSGKEGKVVPRRQLVTPARGHVESARETRSVHLRAASQSSKEHEVRVPDDWTLESDGTVRDSRHDRRMQHPQTAIVGWRPKRDMCRTASLAPLQAHLSGTCVSGDEARPRLSQRRQEGRNGERIGRVPR